MVAAACGEHGQEDLCASSGDDGLHKLPQTAEIAPDDEVKKPPRLTKCACGNYARPGETLCNACTELLVKKTQPAGDM